MDVSEDLGERRKADSGFYDVGMKADNDRPGQVDSEKDGACKKDR